MAAWERFKDYIPQEGDMTRKQGWLNWQKKHFTKRSSKNPVGLEMREFIQGKYLKKKNTKGEKK